MEMTVIQNQAANPNLKSVQEEKEGKQRGGTSVKQVKLLCSTSHSFYSRWKLGRIQADDYEMYICETEGQVSF